MMCLAPSGPSGSLATDHYHYHKSRGVETRGPESWLWSGSGRCYTPHDLSLILRAHLSLGSYVVVILIHDGQPRDLVAGCHYTGREPQRDIKSP